MCTPPRRAWQWGLPRPRRARQMELPRVRCAAAAAADGRTSPPRRVHPGRWSRPPPLCSRACSRIRVMCRGGPVPASLRQRWLPRAHRRRPRPRARRGGTRGCCRGSPGSCRQCACGLPDTACAAVAAHAPAGPLWRASLGESRAWRTRVCARAGRARAPGRSRPRALSCACGSRRCARRSRVASASRCRSSACASGTRRRGRRPAA
mmetsp:Transcript_6342/g.16540  ORF Transcript_6342/g.16540 Transcript_6342/m.16540 type:complete len:207 (+) Transcript_6342:93-713(+)